MQSQETVMILDSVKTALSTPMEQSQPERMNEKERHGERLKPTLIETTIDEGSRCKGFLANDESRSESKENTEEKNGLEGVVVSVDFLNVEPQINKEDNKEESSVHAEKDVGGEVTLEEPSGIEKNKENNTDQKGVVPALEKELTAEEKTQQKVNAFFDKSEKTVELFCAQALLRLIPASEWGMPMTLWVVQGGITTSQWMAAYELASGLEGVEKQDCSVWVIDKKVNTENIHKQKDIVFIEQSGGAKDAAKALLLAGKFVVWISRSHVEKYAKDNARGILECPSHAQRIVSRLDQWHELGLKVETPGGQSLQEHMTVLGGLKPYSVSSEASIDRLLSVFLEKTKTQAKAAVEQSSVLVLTERDMVQISRCYGFVQKNYPNVRRGDPNSLAETVGLSLDTRQALESLVRRVRLAGKGRGVLFHGLPGTGKTMMAKVVAIESERTWVEASYTDWQSCEHLGEHLSNMSASFIEAIENAPSVMFIDELDSIGKRGGAEKHNSNYMLPVINAMLEWVEEAIARDVVIIGATNYPSAIDSALVRPGRLGHWIEIKYPDKAQRAELISKELPRVGDAMTWSSRIGRASPAKIMELVYEARERARERGALEPEFLDLQEAMESEVQRNLRGRSMRALGLPVALGLCAKAWMIKMAYPKESSVPRVIQADTSPGIEDVGRLELEGTFETGSGDLAWARLQVALAAAAARIVHARRAGNIDGLCVLADLDQRDRAEARVCLQELSSTGLAKPSGSKGGVNWLDPERGAGELMNAAWTAALASLDHAMPVLMHVAKELEQCGVMSGDELMSKLGFAPNTPKNGWTH